MAAGCAVNWPEYLDVCAAACSTWSPRPAPFAYPALPRARRLSCLSWHAPTRTYVALSFPVLPPNTLSLPAALFRASELMQWAGPAARHAWAKVRLQQAFDACETGEYPIGEAAE